MKLPIWCSILVVSIYTLFQSGCASGDTYRLEDGRSQSAAESRVEQVRGNVEYSENGSDWKDSYAGQAIVPGTRLRTGPDSEARVNLGRQRGGWIRVLPGSVVIFERLEPATSNSEVGVILNLPKGQVVGDTARTVAGKKILVKTPNGMHEITADGR